MAFSGLRLFLSRICWQTLFCLILGITYLLAIGISPALADIKDDRFDGNIFVLYGSNGSLVPAKTSLANSLKQRKPALLVFYLDDSSDCKQYAPVVSYLQAFYGRAVSFIPVNVDTIRPEVTYKPTEPGYYYSGRVPQTVLLNQAGEVVLNAKGNLPFEQVDDVLREVFDLLPRSESVELKRRSVNQFSTELR